MNVAADGDKEAALLKTERVLQEGHTSDVIEELGKWGITAKCDPAASSSALWVELKFGRLSCSVDAAVRLFTAIGEIPTLTTLDWCPHGNRTLGSHVAYLVALLRGARSLTTLKVLCFFGLMGSPEIFECLAGVLNGHPRLMMIDLGAVLTIECETAAGCLLEALATVPNLTDIRLGAPWSKAQDYYCHLTTICASPGLQRIQIYDLGSEAFMCVAPALCASTSLLNVDVACLLSEHCCGEVATIILNNRKLRNLTVLFECDPEVKSFDEKITAHMLPIVEAIRNNQTLIKLQLDFKIFLPGSTETRSVHVAKKVYKAIEASLAVNMTLQNFVLFDPYEMKGEQYELTMKKAGFYAFLNFHGRKTLLEKGGEATMENWVDMLIVHRDNCPALFYYLSLNPSLLCVGPS